MKEAGSFRRGWEGGVPYAHSVEAQSWLQAGGCAQGLLPSLNYVNGQSWAREGRQWDLASPLGLATQQEQETLGLYL